MVKASDTRTAYFNCSVFAISFPSIEVNEAQAYCVRLELVEEEELVPTQ